MLQFYLCLPPRFSAAAAVKSVNHEFALTDTSKPAIEVDYPLDLSQQSYEMIIFEIVYYIKILQLTLSLFMS